MRHCRSFILSIHFVLVYFVWIEQLEAWNTGCCKSSFEAFSVVWTLKHRQKEWGVYPKAVLQQLLSLVCQISKILALRISVALKEYIVHARLRVGAEHSLPSCPSVHFPSPLSLFSWLPSSLVSHSLVCLSLLLARLWICGVKSWCYTYRTFSLSTLILFVSPFQRTGDMTASMCWLSRSRENRREGYRWVPNILPTWKRYFQGAELRD